MLDDGSVHQRQVEICLAYAPTSAGAVSVKREARLVGKQFQLERFVRRAARQFRKLGKQVPILIKFRMIRLGNCGASGYAIDMLINGRLGMHAWSRSCAWSRRSRPACIILDDGFPNFGRHVLRLGDKALGTCLNVRKPIVRIDNAR